MMNENLAEMVSSNNTRPVNGMSSEYDILMAHMNKRKENHGHSKSRRGIIARTGITGHGKIRAPCIGNTIHGAQ